MADTPPRRPFPYNGAEPVNAELDDPTTEKAVEEIAGKGRQNDWQDSDRRAGRQNFSPSKHGFWHRVGRVFSLWLGTAWGRWITFFVLLAALGVGAGVPTARYFCLNAAGVQSTASVTVLDNVLGTPLKNVQVTLEGKKIETDVKGTAHFSGLKLGPADLTIAQLGFATVKKHVIIGWGSNALGQVSLTSVGLRYTITVRDYLTNQPITGAEASVGQSSATSDNTGKMILTLPGNSSAGSVSIAKAGYRTDQFALQPSGQTTDAELVTTQKEVYVAQTDGTYNLFKADMDGKNRQQLLPGTGTETTHTSLVLSPDATHAALVSIRDSQKAADGQPLNTLTLISVADSTPLTLAHAETIRLIDWIGPKLIFEQTNPDSGAAGTSIISYDFVTNSRAQLASGTTIGGVLSAQGTVYYSVGADASNPAVQPGFYKVNPDGNGRQQTFTKEVTSAVRADFSTFDLNAADGWYAYTVSNDNAGLTTSPAAGASRLYLDNANRSGVSASIKNGNVITHTVSGGSDVTVSAPGGATQVVTWVGPDALVYRLATESESADYAVGVNGGTPRKVADALNTAGFSQGQ
ncbi:MAG TPA: hypothetical protein VLH84_05935 [Patescibacteria group bacterium]|nr:hypothetical protein [Patescibacteria group bacterium]